MKLYKNKDWLQKKYWDERLSLYEIAKEVNHHPTCIMKQLEKNNIPRRTRKEANKMREKSGENSHSWKGERRTGPNGYIFIYSPNHPRKIGRNRNQAGGYMYEHRLVMEKHIGRYLYPWEIVHHINGIRDDNKIENLELLPKGRHNKKVQEVYKENLFLKEQLANFLSIKT